MWFYIYDQADNLYTVGINDGDKWRTDSDHADRESAARRVNYLNGGNGFPFELTPAHKIPFAGGAPGKFGKDPEQPPGI